MRNKKLENLEKGIRFKKGQSGNPKGRPKALKTILKEQGLTESQTATIAKVMMSMTVDELKAITQNNEASAWELILASTFRTAIQRGDISQILNLLNRLYGQPKQELDLTQKQIVWNETKTYEKSDKKK